MSNENTNPVMTSNRLIVRLFLGAVLVAGLLLILPLYMQNRMTSLYAKSHELTERINALEKDILHQELEINKLSSLENLLKVSEGWEMGLYEVPTKIRVVGGAK